MNSELKKIPYLGVGVGLRPELAKNILRYAEEIDVLEVISEQFFSSRPTSSHEFIKKFAAKFPIIPHGVKLSIGAATPLEENFIEEARKLSERLGAHYYSDHFTLTRHGRTLDTGHLSPLWYTREMLEHIVERVDTIQQKLGLPLVLENITAELIIPEADYEESEFLTEVCRRTGCGLLLDLTNLHINAYNRDTDASALLLRYPLDSVVQLHLAGGVITHGRFLDTHSAELSGPNEGVWDLLEKVVPHTSIKAAIIERDQDFKPDFEEMILTDLRRARGIIEKMGKISKTKISSQDFQKQ